MMMELLWIQEVQYDKPLYNCGSVLVCTALLHTNNLYITGWYYTVVLNIYMQIIGVKFIFCWFE